jgi:hypothetical protein
MEVIFYAAKSQLSAVIEGRNGMQDCWEGFMMYIAEMGSGAMS